jgi:hypothetical protein
LTVGKSQKNMRYAIAYVHVKSCETNYINPKSSIESGLQDRVCHFNDAQLT